MPPPQLPERYLGRTAENRRRLAQAHGGSLDTEVAVEAALAWLAQRQDAQTGHWDNRRWEGGQETRDLGGITYGVRAETAVTGLSLLTFLGAGHTHREGPYAENVRRGLEYLIHSQSKQTGSLAGDASPYVGMYCHGIATLAMSEALIMTNDPQIRPGLILRRRLHHPLSASCHRGMAVPARRPRRYESIWLAIDGAGQRTGCRRRDTRQHLERRPTLAQPSDAR